MSARATCSCGWTSTYSSRERAEVMSATHACVSTSAVRRATRHHRCARCGLEATYDNAGATEARYWFNKHSCRKHEDRMLRAALGAARSALVDRVPKPCLHKIANHQHGTYAAYVLDRCRCEPCSKANSDYESNRQRQIAYGRWNQHIPAGPVRAHVRSLMDAGIGLKRIAKISGVSTGALSKLIYGVYAPGPAGRNGKGDLIRQPSRRVLRENAEKLYAIDPTWDGGLPLAAGAIDHQRTPTARTHLRALVALGWSISELGRRLEITNRANVTPLFAGDRPMTRGTVDRVEALYAALSMQLPQPKNRHQQAAVTRSLNMAKARGWLPPLALEELDPNEQFEDVDVDQVAVARRMGGDKTIRLNKAEKVELRQRWIASGRPVAEMERVTGISGRSKYARGGAA